MVLLMFKVAMMVIGSLSAWFLGYLGIHIIDCVDKRGFRGNYATAARFRRILGGLLIMLVIVWHLLC